MSRIVLAFLIFLTIVPSLSAGEGFIVESIGKARSVEPRKRLVEQVLWSDEMYFGYSALSIILDSGLIEPRGQMRGKSIRLSPNVEKESEFLQLLIHEVGHYIDIYSLVSVWNGIDPSTYFYSISWEKKNTKKSDQTLQSFISGYAATNQYEDFAESFTFYIFHNEDFADRAMKNEFLRQKYLFFWEYVFPVGTFLGTNFGTSKVPSYLWDTTKISVSVKKYLYFLRDSL